MVGFFKDLITKIMSFNSNKYVSGSKCNLTIRNLIVVKNKFGSTALNSFKCNTV